MSLNRVRVGAVAAWLGAIALACNALLPIRAAFQLGLEVTNARECGHYEGVRSAHDAGWWLLSLLIGHDPTADPLRSHGGLHPAIGTPCGATSRVAAIAAPLAPLLTVPLFRRVVRRPAFDLSALPPALPVAYRSRAPPLA
jgi:hypothetical protein